MFQLDSSKGRRPPGPRGLEVFQAVYRSRMNILDAFKTVVRKYGDIVSYSVSDLDVYIVTRPEDVQHVLQTNHRNYKKAVTYKALEPVLGNGLLLSEGDFWLRQRRLVAPMFHRKQVRRFAEIMVEEAHKVVDELGRAADSGREVDVASIMSRLTLAIVGRVLFNRDIGRKSDDIGEAMEELFRDVNRRITSLWSIPLEVPTPHNLKMRGYISQLTELVDEMIEARRGREDEHQDLLSMLLLAEDEDTGERMTDKQIRDEVMTFVLAGHETTSNALGWTFMLLSEHPTVRRKLQAEIDEHWDEERDPVEQVRELTYLEQVLDESMRLYPPAWTIEREPIEDDEIRGYHIPAGCVLVTAPYLVHHNPDVWENPEGFDPERFTPERKQEHHRYAHFPFGGGPRMCVGADFAIMEAKLILAEVMRRFDLNLAGYADVELEANVTLHPMEGLPMTVRRRGE
jgi:cytochrome P450